MGRPEGIAALCLHEAADQPVGRESKKLYFGSDLCYAGVWKFASMLAWLRLGDAKCGRRSRGGAAPGLKEGDKVIAARHVLSVCVKRTGHGSLLRYR